MLQIGRGPGFETSRIVNTAAMLPAPSNSGGEGSVMSEDNGIRKPELDACLSMGELRILARLGQLAATMASIEVVFCNTPSPPNDPGYAERAAAREALKAVMKFCWDVRIERSPL